MSHEVWERCVYSFMDEMWHQLVKASKVPTFATPILEKEWEGGALIELRPAQVFFNGAMQETGDFAIVRGSASFDQTEKIFGYVSERFKPVQYRDVTLMFDTMVGKPAESAGILFDGKQIFISWKMPEFETVGDELHIPYGVITVGLDNKMGGSLFTSIFKPICANTLSLSQNWAERKENKGKGKGMIYKGTKVNPNMLKDLGYWMKFVDANAEKEVALVKGFFSKLAMTPVKNDAEVHEILYTAFPTSGQLTDYYPDELRGAKEEKMQKADESSEKIRDGIFTLFSGAGVGIKPTYKGVLDATTEFFCHYLPSKKPIASSVMFGNRQKLSTQMVEVLRDRVTM